MRKFLRKLSYIPIKSRSIIEDWYFSLQPAPPPTGSLPIKIDNKPCIWMAWPGRNKIADYLELCLESVRRHNAKDFKIVLITPDKITQYIEDIHPAYEYLSYVHKSDYIRCAVLHWWGRMYFDMDTLCFGSLKHWYEKLDMYDLINYNGTPWYQFFGGSAFEPTRRDSNLTREWYSKVRNHLDKRLP